MAGEDDFDCIETSVSDNSFWLAVDILIKKPHVVNKRLWGCKILFRSTHYAQSLKDKKILLKSECNFVKSYQWLKETVLPQFVKWGEECTISEPKSHTESLNLVCSEKYYQKYNNLKLKYGKEMVKIWPECTDPAKFVYEDIAIATYLLLLWEDERSYLNSTTPQTFVDLGCGNGLLVYILAKEGHVGIGIDVRKRQIWDMYSSDIKLEERTITPSDSDLFPNTDWIIGNHSDELTPWIPVIAARSSFRCNFFLLPCCAFNFDGSKYHRKDSSKSQYTEYLQYIQHLCEECGFITEKDRLKIPSTKRICLVSKGRNYSEDKHEHYCKRIQNIISSESSTLKEHTDGQTSWVKDFKPREAIERVRNCTQVDKSLIVSIVDKISSYLLEGCCLDSTWSVGKIVDLNEVVKLIPQDDLKALKSECGGIQTLLRNNHQIFKVQGGKVQLRIPKSVEEVTKSMKQSKNKASNLKLQQKPCWFYNNHPQGCPLNNAECSFLHIKS
ncbi:hypothetical protein O0L34_g7267 [Tuta absoluta]|nr:hypothetical protein O0L34_g7267 [Tuta absoluta]